MCDGCAEGGRVQADAKRAVANAMRMRWRRHRVQSPMKVCTVPVSSPLLAQAACLWLWWPRSIHSVDWPGHGRVPGLSTCT